MGRKKKRFIDKRNAQTFRLVSRSQSDPLYGQLEESQNVLKPNQCEAPRAEEERLEEQQKYGIYYQDDYDYLQHLRGPRTAVQEHSMPETLKKVHLPPELLGSEVRMEGALQKVVPLTGPLPDWDPDIIEALDSAETVSSTEDQLEDDFVLQANGGEPGVPVYVTEHDHSEDDEIPWWISRGDYQPLGTVTDAVRVDSSCSQERLQDDSEEEKSSGMPQCESAAQFTEYSISSSVVPRNDALNLLDEKFEKFMTEYDRSHMGTVEEEVEFGGDAASSNHRLQDAVQDFVRNYTEQTMSEDESVCIIPVAAVEGEVGTDDSNCSTSGSERELVEVEEQRKQWDCESILSTYSTVYNHPMKIKEPGIHHDSIVVSKKTGIAVGVIPGPSTTTKTVPKCYVRRPLHESTEDKRVRKQSVRAERKQRRAEKKSTKLLFKMEQLRQSRTSSCQVHKGAVV